MENAIIDRLETATKLAAAAKDGLVRIPTMDAQALLLILKEQEAVKPVLDEQTGRIWLCGKCGSYVGFVDNDPHDPNEYEQIKEKRK